MKPQDIYTLVVGCEDDYYQMDTMLKFGILRKQTNAYVFTKEELEARDRERDQRVAGEAFEAGFCSGEDIWKDKTPTKTQYLNKLKTKQP